MMNIIDIKSLARLSKKNKILLCVDNTFASPYLQRPLELGADIIIHSATKYIAGHSDVIIGAIVVNNKNLHEDYHLFKMHLELLLAQWTVF